MFHFSRRAAAILSAAGLIAAASTGAANASPSAYPAPKCQLHVIANISSGYLIVKPGTPYHANPAGSCPVIGYHEGKAWLWCYTQLSNYSVWYGVRDADAKSNALGWVYSRNTSNVTSKKLGHC